MKMEIFINDFSFFCFMDASEFKSERTGILKKLPNSIFCSFEPRELPIEIKYSPELVKLLTEASVSLGNLSEAGRKLRNPHLLIIPYLKKEAVLSSKIEGTRTTLSEVFLHEAERKRNFNSDLEEVMNYIEALQYGLSKITDERISADLIKEMHKILLRGVRGENKNPGDYKTELNWIGSSYDPLEAKFIPCPPESVERLIDNLINYLNHHDAESPLLKIGVAHYQFEAIHPFRDGNGRIGRLLIILFLCQQKLIAQPLLYISAFFERHKEDYDLLLRKASTEGNLESWLRFFLTGLKKQSEDALKRVEQLDALMERYRKSLLRKSHSTTVQQIMEFLFENPYITISQISKRLKCYYPKAKYNVEILLDAGIIEETPWNKKEKLFVAKEIKSILDV